MNPIEHLDACAYGPALTFECAAAPADDCLAWFPAESPAAAH
ncbi:hypothetical protein [Streptomyces sp. Ru73]|nr:hypothetical protein [Streptomyces sp. Ru73]